MKRSELSKQIETAFRRVRSKVLSFLRSAGRKVYFAYQKLKKLPAPLILSGIGAISLVLIVILIILIGHYRKTSVVTADASNEYMLSEDVQPGFDLETDVTGEPADPENPESGGPDTDPDTASFTELNEGDKSPLVAEIQNRLMQLGYMDPDEPTEYYGHITEKAIRRFQAHNGLSDDGICGTETFYLLFSEDAKKYVMQSGDSGSDVEGVQQRLYELGYITTTSNVTGTFGEKTLEAVKEFQSSNKLKADGKVGNNTLETLFSENPVSKCYSIGDKNSVIKQVQEKLRKLHYYTGSANGEYTKATAAAVKKFQQCNDLVVDGTLGPSTKAAILSKNAQAYVMQLGESGSNVKKVQTRLSELNYLRSANATGYFGEKTQEAVIAFQERNKLHADGKVGTGTYNALFSSNAKKARPASTASPSSGTNSGNSGSSGGSSGSSSSSNSKGVEKLIEIAQSKLGCNYVRGAKGPNSFDCSGFVYYCLKQSGVSISYMTSIGWRTCNRFTRIDSLSSCKRGDILVFSGSSMETGHVGIYLGSGQMIDAGSSAGCVRITKTVLSGSYWPSHFLMAYRIF